MQKNEEPVNNKKKDDKDIINGGMLMKMPRILLCAGASGSGKTLLTCGILQALINRGIKPASFKCGPDYIDPMFHKKVLGTVSGNLDTFFLDDETLRWLFTERARGCDIAIIEGVMGYYDGLGGISQKASTYDVARATQTPAILIVNGKGVSASLAAQIQGFQNFKADSGIAGVILNHVKEPMYRLLKDYIEETCGIPVIGWLPELTDIHLESRHLGLVMPDEVADLREKLQQLAEVVANTVDLDKLLAIAQTAPAVSGIDPLAAGAEEAPLFGAWHRTGDAPKLRIGVARDAAFCFFYEDNLKLLERLGAEIVPFSPISDYKLPPMLDGMIFYGGYPEIYAEQLSVNQTMQESIRGAYAEGMPILAECGGFLYLGKSLQDLQGKAWPMVGLTEGDGYRTDRLGRFGYIDLTENRAEQPAAGGSAQHEAKAGTAGYFDGYGKIGVLKAHEFHYYDTTANGTAFHAQKPAGKRNWDCIISRANLLAGFPHIYYYANPKFAQIFLDKCSRFRGL